VQRHVAPILAEAHARLQPVAGKKAGERTAFDDPFLVNAVLHKLP
jgi:hypothetical protein